jgi:hypothetical protein
MMQLADMLGVPANFALKQLVWTASTLPATMPFSPTDWLEIGTVNFKVASHFLPTGMKRIMLKTKYGSSNEEL